MAANWQKGAAHAQHPDPDPDDYEDEDDLEELDTPVYQGSGLLATTAWTSLRPAT
jgi:hypothetical protein